MKNKKAIVLLSGGLDSATTLFKALNENYQCYCLTFDYGQRQKKEVRFAKKIAKYTNCYQEILKITLPWGGSSLLNKKEKVPSQQIISGDIPSTYVPSRNTIFLSYAFSWAEAINADAVFIGAHIQDYSGYPDCRPDYFESLKKVFEKGTRAGIENKIIEIKTPILYLSKKEIILLGKDLGVPFELTWSCYQGGRKPCKKCPACLLREKGFKEAGLPDPILH